MSGSAAGGASSPSSRLELDLADPQWPTDDGRARVLLVAINIPRYYSLPVRLLTLVAARSERLRRRFDVRYIECTKDEDLDRPLDIVVSWSPAVLGLSVNVWNRDQCLAFASSFKARLRRAAILAGGQEVTNSVIDYLDDAFPFDYIIDGEGEIAFQEFLSAWDGDAAALKDPGKVSGLRYRGNGLKAYTGPALAVSSLEEVPSAILEGLVPVRGKEGLGVLLEGARCCPCRCAFCFEGGKGGKVRLASIDRLFREADYMASRGARRFHLLDPILGNGNPKRLREIRGLFARIQAAHPGVSFSVEAYADRITEEAARCLELCSTVDVGLQTIHLPTAKAIHRPFSPARFREGLARLRKTRSPFNLFLISGLPYETVASFLRAVRFALGESPTRLFLNELCLLNGTELRARAEEYGYEFDSAPPYYARASRWISRREMAFLHALSREFSLRFNSSFRSMLPTAPWTRHDGEREWHETMRVVLARRRADLAQDRDAEMAYDAGRAEGRNVEIVADNETDLGALLRLAGELQLAGAARIRLAAPCAYFMVPGRIERLIRAGVWGCTLLGLDARNEPDGAADFVRDAERCLKSLTGVFSVGGGGQLWLHVEVLLESRGEPGRILDAALLAGRHGAHMVTIPGEGREDDDAWVSQVEEIWERTLETRCWVKLPAGTMRRLIEDIDEADEILGHLRALGLVCSRGED